MVVLRQHGKKPSFAPNITAKTRRIRIRRTRRQKTRRIRTRRIRRRRIRRARKAPRAKRRVARCLLEGGSRPQGMGTKGQSNYTYFVRRPRDRLALVRYTSRATEKVRGAVARGRRSDALVRLATKGFGAVTAPDVAESGFEIAGESGTIHERRLLHAIAQGSTKLAEMLEVLGE